MRESQQYGRNHGHPKILDQSCIFLSLPLELRILIYRYIVISRLDCRSHPRLWRPLGVDGGISRIGYFDSDAVTPLLLTCWQVHEEAVTVLYGENTFAFHISGLEPGPVFFLAWLAPRYVKLLRRVYIRTGYHADTQSFHPGFLHATSVTATEPPPRRIKDKAAHDLAVSVALMKQAWPVKYDVFVNTHATIAYSEDEVASLLNQGNTFGWPASSYYLWKMIVTERPAKTPRFEFMRIEWGSPCVKNLKADGTRVTFL